MEMFNVWNNLCVDVAVKLIYGKEGVIVLVGKDNSILYLDGKPLCVTEMPKITFEPNKDNTYSFSACETCSITGTFIYLRISRKKFVRNLIKQGYSKKNAKWIAWYCCKKRIPYSKANTLIYFGLSIVWGDYGCYLTAW